jgi:hypothetical protein
MPAQSGCCFTSATTRHRHYPPLPSSTTTATAAAATDFKAESISGDTKVLNEQGKPMPLPKK